MHSYQVIRLAAEQTKAETIAATEVSGEKLSKSFLALKFSNWWIQCFLKRFRLSRQRITSAVKADRPPPDEVQRVMADLQKHFTELGLELSDILWVTGCEMWATFPSMQPVNFFIFARSNMDETATVWGMNPKYLYLPANSGGRAAAPAADERARFTTNNGLCANGTSLPPSFIIKCSTDNVDQSRCRVLDTLLADPSFNSDKRWTKEVWTRTMEVLKKVRAASVRLIWDTNRYIAPTVSLQGSKKGEVVKVAFKRPYLIHPDGRVVWAQSSAYQDTPGLAMWCDLVMKPARIRSGRPRWALVWDNCKAHLVKSVLDVFTEAGIHVFALPPNMTDLLQPVDIVPNGPLKARIRSKRAFSLYNYFQDWREIAESAQKSGSVLPLFDPPSPTMGEGISLVSDIYATHFSTREFMAGVRRCFVSVGLAADNDGLFVKYVSHTQGKVRADAFRNVIAGTASLSDNVTELEGAALFEDFEFENGYAPDEGYGGEEPSGGLEEVLVGR